MSSKTLLEEVDIPGQSYLREALTSCLDPLKGMSLISFTNSQR